MNPSYADWVALGALTGVVALLAQRARTVDDAARLLTACVTVGAFALVLGRAGHALLNLDYFREHAGELISVRSSGFAATPALFGGFIGWLVTGRRIPAGDAILTATLIGVGACLGCAQSGCGYGREVFWQDGGLGWLLRADLPDAYTLSNPRLPTQALTAAWLIASALTVWAVALRRAPGATWALPAYIVMVCLGDAVIEGWRADPMPVWLGARGPMWLNVGVSTLAIGCAFATMIFVRLRRLTP